MNYIIIGCGYAGAVCARILADEGNTVTVYDRRSHIAGNMYEETDASGVIIHKYGPHISVMKDERVFNFLSRFTEWVPYEHRVNALIDGVEVPLPINFNSILALFDSEHAHALIRTLIANYGVNVNVPILTLRQSKDKTVNQFAEYIYDRVFLHYTEKMWGLTPEQIDPAVTGRVPVRLSFDNRHFQHTFQVMPKQGFNALFTRLLDSPNITVCLNTDSRDIITPNLSGGEIIHNGSTYDGRVIYTGALDELFNYCYGELPYRTLRFEHETHHADFIQDSTVLNYPDARPDTRRTEMKRLTGQVISSVTSTIREFPGAYVRGDKIFGEPFYPIIKPENEALYKQYVALADTIPALYTVGRLADYRYYNMEDTVLRAMQFASELK